MATEERFVYNQLDFAKPAGSDAVLLNAFEKKRATALGKGRAKSIKMSGRDYKTLLSKVEAHERTVEAVRARGNEEKAQRLEMDKKWEYAMRRLQGDTIKDDATKLRRSLKKKQKQKEKCKEKWDERVKSIKEKQKERQVQRRENIKKRKEKRGKAK